MLFDSVEAKPHPIPGLGGTQRVYGFANDWGASVIHGTRAQLLHGGYELAVTEGPGGKLNYDYTSGDVVQGLTKTQVELWLKTIRDLPPRHLTPYEVYQLGSLWERIHGRIMWYALRFGHDEIDPKPWKP